MFAGAWRVVDPRSLANDEANPRRVTCRVPRTRRGCPRLQKRDCADLLAHMRMASRTVAHTTTAATSAIPRVSATALVPARSAADKLVTMAPVEDDAHLLRDGMAWHGLAWRGVA